MSDEVSLCSVRHAHENEVGNGIVVRMAHATRTIGLPSIAKFCATVELTNKKWSHDDFCAEYLENRDRPRHGAHAQTAFANQTLDVVSDIPVADTDAGDERAAGRRESGRTNGSRDSRRSNRRRSRNIRICIADQPATAAGRSDHAQALVIAPPSLAEMKPNAVPAMMERTVGTIASSGATPFSRINAAIDANP